jgi:hypothetical protein
MHASSGDNGPVAMNMRHMVTFLGKKKETKYFAERNLLGSWKGCRRTKWRRGHRDRRRRIVCPRLFDGTIFGLLDVWYAFHAINLILE